MFWNEPQTIIATVFFLILFSLAYFKLWQIIDDTFNKVDSYKQSFKDFKNSLFDMTTIIKDWEQEFLNLKTQIHLQKSDSSRLTEWLDKRDKELQIITKEFLKNQKIAERETKIIKISEQLNLITHRKN